MGLDMIMPHHANPYWGFGIALELGATLAGCFGKQLLRFAALTEKTAYYLIGLFLTSVINPAFDLSAYHFAAQSVVAPCAGMVIVWNVLLAPLTLGEELTQSRLIAACLVCVGTFFTGMFGDHESMQYTVYDYVDLFTRPMAWIYYLLFFVFAAFCSRKYATGSATEQACAMASLGGALAGNTFPTKAAVELTVCLLRDHEYSVRPRPAKREGRRGGAGLACGPCVTCAAFWSAVRRSGAPLTRSSRTCRWSSTS